MHHGREQQIRLPDQPEQAVDSNMAWQPPILQTTATEGKGIPELAQQIAAHHTYLLESGTLAAREQSRIETEIVERLRETLVDWLLAQTDPAVFADLIRRVQDRTVDPASAARDLIGRFTETGQS